MNFTEGGEFEVSASADKADQTGVPIRIAVRNTAIGIPGSGVCVFESFRQWETGLAGNDAGLGLAVAQRLAILLRGSLMAKSEWPRQRLYGPDALAGRPYRSDECKGGSGSCPVQAQLTPHRVPDMQMPVMDRFQTAHRLL